MNNLKNNIVRTQRQLARRKPARGNTPVARCHDERSEVPCETSIQAGARSGRVSATRELRSSRKAPCEPSSDKLSSQLFSLFPTRLSVTDGDTTRTFSYHADGQLASATVGTSSSRPGRDALVASDTETFLWDGLALIQRGDEQFVNEPHVGGGNPVASSKGTSYFNDALGTTVGSWEGRASSRPESGLKYSAAALTAFGENLSVDSPTPTQNSNFFTGKPYVEGLGHAFWMRNYRAGLAKWQTADPMGYPDGWNQLAYCGNGVISGVDIFGCFTWVDTEHPTISNRTTEESKWNKVDGGYITDDGRFRVTFWERTVTDYGDVSLRMYEVDGLAVETWSAIIGALAGSAAGYGVTVLSSGAIAGPWGAVFGAVAGAVATVILAQIDPESLSKVYLGDVIRQHQVIAYNIEHDVRLVPITE